MDSREQLDFLRQELAAWRRRGLIDEPTFHRLSEDCAARLDPEQVRDDAALAVAADAVAADAQAVAADDVAANAQAVADDDVAANAQAVADDDVAANAQAVDAASSADDLAGAKEADDAEDDLERSLAAEAAFHAELEADVAGAERAEAAARALGPVAERPAALGRALAAAASDLAAMPDDVDAEPETPEQRVVARDTVWSEVVRPFLLANGLWLAGALLIVAGSIYFLRLAWDHLANVPLHAVIAGALHGYGAAFFGVGYLLCRKREAHGVGRILFAFACAILPLGSVAVGALARVSIDAWGGAGAAVVVPAIALALALQGFMLAVIAGLYERAALRLTVTTGLALALLVMLVSLAERALAALAPAVPVAALLLPLGFAALARGLLSLPRRRVHLRMSVLLFGGAMLWAFTVLAVRAHLAGPVAVTHYAALAGWLAVVLLTTDHRLRRAADLAPRLTALGAGFHAALLAAVALSIAGLAAHGYGDVWARVTVLVSASAATFGFARGAWHHGRRALTVLAASAGLLVYFFLPAPFSALIALAQETLTSALGYGSEPLPVAFYGLTFVPYLALVTALSLRLRPRRPDLARDLEVFLIALGGLLVVLATGGRGDLRPMLWTWPLYAAGGFVGARVFGRPYLVHAGHVITLAWLGVAYHALWPHHSPGPTLAGYGLAAALALLAPGRRGAGHLLFAAVIGGLAGLLSLPVPAGEVGVSFATVLLVAANAGLLAYARRHPVYAFVAVGALLAAGPIAALGWGLDAPAALALLLGQAALFSALVHLVRRAPDDDPRWTLVARPALAGAALAAFMAWAPALYEYPHGAPLAIALLFGHLAWIGRDAVIMVAAGLTGLAAAGLAALAGDDNAWPVAVAAVSGAYLAGAALLPAGWPRSKRRALALAAVALLGFGLGAVGQLDLALADAGGHAPLWWLLAAAQLVLLTVVSAWIWWRDALPSWRPLWAHAWPGALLLGAECAVIAGAAALSTGRHPEAAVLALMAPVALLVAWWLDRFERRRRDRRDVAAPRRVAFIGLAGAATLAALAIADTLPAPPGFVTVLGLLTLTLGGALLVRQGLQDAVTARVYQALACVTTAYILFRAVIGAALPAIDITVILLAAQVAFWVSQTLPPTRQGAPARAVLRGPLLVAAMLWPLAVLVVMYDQSAATRSALGVLVAVHYGVVGGRSRRRHLWPLTLGFANLALLFGWSALGWAEVLLYAVPVAFSVLVLVHVYGPELGRGGRNLARLVILCALYALALLDALSAATPVLSLVGVPLLCVAAIVAGVLLQVRVYAGMGVAVLAVDLAANLVRYGLESRVLGAVFLTLLGLALVAVMVVFQVERERLLRRYSAITGKLRTWE